MKVLVTGANGFLGQDLCAGLLQEGFSVIATGKGDCRLPFAGVPGFRYLPLDFTREEEVRSVMAAETPAVVVHAGAMGKPDECELNKTEAYRVNVEGTRHLLEAAAIQGSFFIFLSTDFVFDGSNGPYAETDTPCPVNYYGHTKLEAEELVRKYAFAWSIVRTVLVYGKALTGRPNLLSLVKEKTERGELFQAVNDQWRTPTFVGDLSGGILEVIRREAKGIFHLSGREMMTPYDMAVAVSRFLGREEALIQKVASSGLPQPARRPAKTGFIIRKAEEQLGYRPLSFAEGLARSLGD